ncbi:DUF6377 domain-containing protein [Carboxylicivirga linearis]|uniref:DUF6377 domain-containing protein n=1 Tax=Carboxylicivirga linearis TaxID=1628157 RepID=A0ABS5JWT1_9BACT|nr:DUF6377 domain-containing protein [Carboxylicivirga linearis]MBS2099337.1 hypothetical protein [Carboxylicivirga linearis]
MKRFLFLTFGLCYLLSLEAQNTKIDSLFQLLDNAIERKPIFIKERIQTIDSLKLQLNHTETTEDIYHFSQKLYDEYKTFQYDSAYHYAMAIYRQSKSLKDTYWYNQSCLDLAFIMTSSGLYTDSYRFIEDIITDSLTNKQRLLYYNYCSRYFHDLTLFNGRNLFSDEYWYKSRDYLDSLITLSEQLNQPDYIHRGQLELYDGNIERAKNQYLRFIENQNSYSQDYSITTSTLSFIYSVSDNPELQKQYAIMAAISDIHCAITENASFHKLALILYDEGDTERAYQLIKLSLDDANYYNARLRRVEIAKSLPIIEKAFHDKLNREKRRLAIALAAISFLALLILFAAFYILKQLKELRQNRMVIQLTNDQLNQLNRDLLESNKIKEEYIGHFLNLCSQYIDKIEQFQQLVQRKIKVGQIDSLLAMTKSKKLINEEMQELLMSFDRIFLKLFPDFKDEFNALFEPENQFSLKKDELLNTELRIFALIRLGVHDSSKIAQFLRYSVNTVYTYRTKVKNRAKIDRDKFENEIMKIDSFTS